MNDYSPTAILTNHARERCAEMSISTKVPKRIVANASLVRPDYAHSERRVAISDQVPGYAVVFEPGDPPLIITVLFHCSDFKQRNGCTYIPEQRRPEEPS